MICSKRIGEYRHFILQRVSQSQGLHGRSRVCLVLFLKIPIAMNSGYGQGLERSPETVQALGSVKRTVKGLFTRKVCVSVNVRFLYLLRHWHVRHTLN